MIVIACICLLCFSNTVQKKLCLGLDVRVGLVTIKTSLMLYCSLNGYFPAYFSQLHFILAIKWVG